MEQQQPKYPRTGLFFKPFKDGLSEHWSASIDLGPCKSCGETAHSNYWVNLYERTPSVKDQPGGIYPVFNLTLKPKAPYNAPQVEQVDPAAVPPAPFLPF